MGSSDALRPRSTRPVALTSLAATLGLTHYGPDTSVTGVAMGSKAVQPGDLFVALRGVNRQDAKKTKP